MLGGSAPSARVRAHAPLVGARRPSVPRTGAAARPAPAAGGWRSVGGPVRVLHALTLVAAFGVWAYLDRHLWFYGDEWDFLTRRGLHGAYFSLWAPHNEHWSVLPILLWRGLYSIWHLSSYWPYLVPLLLVHVALVNLVWRRCLTEGADPWVASATALLVALLGSGAEDLTWAFQIGFLGSVLFGLVSWEVAESSWRQRRPWPGDVLVAALALAALMCSTVGLAMAAGLVVVLVARSGWRRALVVMAVPAASYLVWFALSGHKGLGATGDSFGATVFLRLPLFVALNLAHQLGAMASWAAVGPFLAVGLLAWALWFGRRLFRHHPALLGAAVAAVAFYALAALGRDRIAVVDDPSRYIYVGGVLVAPLVAQVLSGYPAPRLARAARFAMVGALALATVGNLVAGADFARSRTNFVNGIKAQILTTGALLQDRLEAQRTIKEYPFKEAGRTAGYLTGDIVSQLYRDRLLAHVSMGAIGPVQLLVDESWLDLVGTGEPRYPSRLTLAVAAGFTVSDVPAAFIAGGAPAQGPRLVRAVKLAGGSATVNWPSGPGHCALVLPLTGLDRHRYRSWLRLASADVKAAGSVWVSLGGAGGDLWVSLAAPWAPSDGKLLSSAGAAGQKFDLSPDAHVWVDDSVPGDGLVIRLVAGQGAELCGLAVAAGPGTYVAKL